MIYHLHISSNYPTATIINTCTIQSMKQKWRRTASSRLTNGKQWMNLYSNDKMKKNRGKPCVVLSMNESLLKRQKGKA